VKIMITDSPMEESPPWRFSFWSKELFEIN